MLSQMEVPQSPSPSFVESIQESASPAHRQKGKISSRLVTEYLSPRSRVTVHALTVLQDAARRKEGR